jgi:hypothetical protein
MHKGYFENDIPKRRGNVSLGSQPYTLYGEKLYKLRLDGIFQ